MNRRKLIKVLPWITTPGLLIVLFVVWELSVKALNVSPLVLPPPTKVFENLGDFCRRRVRGRTFRSPSSRSRLASRWAWLPASSLVSCSVSFRCSRPAFGR